MRYTSQLLPKICVRLIDGMIPAGISFLRSALWLREFVPATTMETTISGAQYLRSVERCHFCFQGDKPIAQLSVNGQSMYGSLIQFYLNSISLFKRIAKQFKRKVVLHFFVKLALCVIYIVSKTYRLLESSPPL